MSSLTFIYMKNEYIINIKDQQTLITEVLLNYSKILKKNINQLYFVYNGKQLSFNNNKTIKEFKKNNIKIFIFNLEKKENKNNEKLNQIICPECENLAVAKIIEGKISIEKCIYNHKISNLSVDLFIKLQNLKKQIECLKCKLNTDYYENFYLCSCNEIFCQLCKNEHLENNISHYMIEYNKRFYYCIEHKKEYKSFCDNCKINMCSECEEKHEKHKNKIIIFKKIKPTEKILNEMTNEIYDFNKKISHNIKELDSFDKKVNNYINSIKNKLNGYIEFYNFIFNSLYNLKNY